MLELIWPSKKKIKKLRLEGKTLFSTTFFRAILLLTAIFVISTCAKNFTDFAMSYFQIATEPSANSLRIGEILNIFWKTIIFPTLIMAAIGFASILLCTKFLFNPSLAALNFSRCSWRANKHRTNVWQITNKLLIAIAGLIIISASMIKILPALFSSLSYPLDDSASGLYSSLLEIRDFTILILSLLLPLIFLLNWLTFNLQHRMSKAELLTEASNNDKNEIAKV